MSELNTERREITVVPLEDLLDLLLRAHQPSV